MPRGWVGEKRNWRQKIGTSSFVEEGSRARARGENGVKREFFFFMLEASDSELGC